MSTLNKYNNGLKGKCFEIPHYSYPQPIGTSYRNHYAELKLMINITIDYIIEKLGEHYSSDINKNRSSLLMLVQTNTDLAQVLHDAKVKMDFWEYYLEVLIEKIIHTSLSVIKLSEGIKFNTYKEKELNIPMIDSSSVFILTRSILECYLTLHYIYIANIPKTERHFRFKLWQISGIITRQNASTHSSEELKMKKEEEKILIEQLRSEIEADPEFKNLENNHINKLNKYGLPRKDSWSTLIKDSDLDNTYFQDMYSLFSNYAHSEYLSTLQLKQSTRNIDDSININRIGVSFLVIRSINALIANWLKSNFKSVELVYNTMPTEFQNVVNIWTGIATKKKS